MPNLQHDVRDLMNGVGHYLGYNEEPDPLAATLTFWDADQLADVKRNVNAGYRQFLYPPVLDEGKKPYEWSFLTPTAALAFVAGVQKVDLPIDFGGILFGATLDFGNTRLGKVSEDRFNALTGGVNSTTGVIKYVSVLRPVQVAATEVPYELGVYPTPTSDSIVRFRYMREAPMLDDTNEIPWGGDRHSETIMQSCLAAAELSQDDEHGVHWERFKMRRSYSIAIDDREKDDLADNLLGWPIDEVETEEISAQITYHDLRRELGAEAGYGRDPMAWNHEQTRLIEFVVQNGYRRYWAPPVLEGQTGPWDWSFNKPIAELVTARNVHLYDLPIDCGSIVEEFTYKAAELT
jgi:hypothetical protein